MKLAVASSRTIEHKLKGNRYFVISDYRLKFNKSQCNSKIITEKSKLLKYCVNISEVKSL